jgi:hypothetical protein
LPRSLLEEKMLIRKTGGNGRENEVGITEVETRAVGVDIFSLEKASEKDATCVYTIERI